MKVNKLKHHLLFTPLFLLSLSFLLLFVAFDFIIQIYIENVTSNSIKNELLYMELIYCDADKINKEDKFEDENFFILVNHIIIGEAGDIISTGDYYGEGKKMRKDIANYLVSNHLLADEDVETVSYDSRKYYAKINEFDLSRSRILKEKAKPNEKYYSVIFGDVTSIHKLHLILNLILGLLILIVIIPTILMSYLNSKKLEQSFFKLQNCVMKLGKKETINPDEDFNFDEFNQMKNTTLEISKKLEDAEKSREIFFQNASHELRTPLMNIQGYAESIAKNISKDNVHFANIILNESKKMKSLVDDILTLSRMETGAHQIHLEEIEVKEILNSCIYGIQRIAKDRNITIQCDFEKRGFLFHADEDKLSHAITNILSNAVRYAKTCIEINYETMEEYVVLSFYNDGEAIDKEDLPHIFDRFYKGKGGKFGIGLALCKEIIKLHQGEINVNSNGQKTCFSIKLPLQLNT